MADTLITPPAEEPVSVEAFRSYMRDPADPDADLARMIKAAREHVEETASLALFDQVREFTLDAWPGVGGDGLGWWDGVRQGSIMQDAPRFVELPRGPLISVVSVKTFAADGTDSTMAATGYYADTGQRPGRLALVPGVAWPIPGRPTAGIAIRYRAGFTDLALIPSAAQQAILQIAAHLYENRGDDATALTIPQSATRLIQRLGTGPRIG